MAISGQLATRPALAAEGARVGAEFRLGACTAAWRGRRFSARIGMGFLLLIVLASGAFIPPFATTGAARAITGGLDAAILAWAILLIVLPPISWTDRLFLYQAGIVLLDARHPEPTALRWNQLESMSITTASGYDDDYVSSCVLRDRAGNTLTVSRHLNAFDEVVAAAERVLAPRLVPALIARFDSGQPATVTNLTADRHALSWGTAWRVPWPEMRAIDFELQGQRAAVKVGWHARNSQRLVLDGQPNSFLVRYLIAHAAALAGITVSGHARHWDGESGWDPEATIAAPTLPASPDEENWRPALKRRHPARTAFVLALVTGIIAGLALTFDHGGVIMPPGSGDSGDSIVSVRQMPLTYCSQCHPSLPRMPIS